MGEGVGRSRREAVMLVVAVCLAAMNMRPTVTALGPVLDQIGADTGLSISALGVLAAVPLVTWAVLSPLTHTLGRRFGVDRLMLWSLLLLALGTGVRSISGPQATLWLGTVLIGAALAVVNVLMPAVVKRDFPGRVAAMTAVYSALLGGFGAIASGVVVPISLAVGGSSAGDWRAALLISGGVLLLPGIVVWVWPALRSPKPSRPGRVKHPRTGIWGDRTAWAVAGYMGLQAATFYMIVTWLAAIAVAAGHSPVAAGVDVMLYQAGSVIGAITLPLALRGRRDERFVAMGLPAVAIAALVGMLLVPTGVAWWAVLLGLGSGAMLAMSLTLISQRARTAEDASALSGMSQGVGYAIAAGGPIVFGWLHTVTAGWTASILLTVVLLCVTGVVGLIAGRPVFVLDHRVPVREAGPDPVRRNPLR
ncbi:MFS transporter [Microbacterium sp.]|uniref:MFS transporter n=1 Tax=Microbacterium sp. TaxID=51671 RepID=UPI003A848DC1